jgi:hypothetical protein
VLTRGPLNKRKWELLQKKGSASDLALDGQLVREQEKPIDWNTMLREMRAAGVRASGDGLDEEERGSCGSAPRVWGFLDGNAVVDLLATDTADNWLHVGLGAAGMLVGSVAGALGMSARREHRRLETAVTEAAGAAATAERPRRRRFPRRRPEDRVAEREPPRTAETGRRE